MFWKQSMPWQQTGSSHVAAVVRVAFRQPALHVMVFKEGAKVVDLVPKRTQVMFTLHSQPGHALLALLQSPAQGTVTEEEHSSGMVWQQAESLKVFHACE